MVPSTAPCAQQIPLATLVHTLRTYEEMLDLLEEMPGERSRSVRRDILRAMEVIQLEVTRSQLRHLIAEPVTK